MRKGVETTKNIDGPDRQLQLFKVSVMLASRLNMLFSEAETEIR